MNRLSLLFFVLFPFCNQLVAQPWMETKEVEIAAIYPKNCAYEEFSSPFILTEQGDLLQLRSPKEELSKLKIGGKWTLARGENGAIQLNDELKDCLRADAMLYNDQSDVLLVDRKGPVDLNRPCTLHGFWYLPTSIPLLLADRLFCFPMPVEWEEEGEIMWATSAAYGWETGTKLLRSRFLGLTDGYLIHHKLKEVAHVIPIGYTFPTKLTAVDGERIRLSDGIIWHTCPEYLDFVGSWARGDEVLCYTTYTKHYRERPDWFSIYGTASWTIGPHKGLLIALNTDLDEIAVFWREAP